MSMEISDYGDIYAGYNAFILSGEEYSQTLAMNKVAPDRVEVKAEYSETDGGRVSATAVWEFDRDSSNESQKSDKDKETEKSESSKTDKSKEPWIYSTARIWA